MFKNLRTFVRAFFSRETRNWPLFAVIVFASFWFYGANYYNSHWYSKWAVMLILLSAIYSIWFGILRSGWIAPILFSVLATGIWSFGWRDAYPGMPMEFMAAMGRASAYASFCVLFFSAFFLIAHKTELYTLAEAFGFVTLANSFVVILQTSHGAIPQGRGGMFGNPSMSGCFIAIGYGCLILRPKLSFIATKNQLIGHTARSILCVVIPLIALGCIHATMPLITLVAVLGGYAWAESKSESRWVSGAVIAAITLFICVYGFWREGVEVLSTTGRWAQWVRAYGVWRKQDWDILIHGFGPGTTQVLFPLSQALALGPDVSQADWFIYLHNDWLQLLIEQGVFGLFSGLLLFTALLVKASKKQPWLFGCVLGYGVAMGGNYMFHLPVHAFLGAALTAMAVSPWFNLKDRSFV